MKKLVLIMMIMLVSTGMYAQGQDTRNNKNNGEKTATKAEMDENKYKVSNSQDFIDGFNWLMETSINEEEEKRQQVAASLSGWIENNPDINVEIDSKLLKFAKTTPQLLPIFMGGYAKYVIENNGASPEDANMAGVISVIDFYEKNQMYLEKDRNIEKFIRLQEKDKLERFVQRKS